MEENKRPKIPENFENMTREEIDEDIKKHKEYCERMMEENKILQKEKRKAYKIWLIKIIISFTIAIGLIIICIVFCVKQDKKAYKKITKEIPDINWLDKFKEIENVYIKEE